MMQVFDTHHINYKNATLKAYKLSDGTTQINFYNVEEAIPTTESGWSNCDIGTEVYTNENGYLFYGSGRLPVGCLIVREDCIVKVFRGNDSPLATFVYHVDEGFAKLSDIHKLKYHADSNGTIQTWNPLTADGQLPEYAFKSEVAGNVWAESEIHVLTAGQAVHITEWTRSLHLGVKGSFIYIGSGTSTARAGQVIHVINHLEDTTGISITILDDYNQSGQIYNIPYGGCATLTVIKNDTDNKNSYRLDIVERIENNPELDIGIIQQHAGQHKVMSLDKTYNTVGTNGLFIPGDTGYLRIHVYTSTYAGTLAADTRTDKYLRLVKPASGPCYIEVGSWWSANCCPNVVIDIVSGASADIGTASVKDTLQIRLPSSAQSLMPVARDVQVIVQDTTGLDAGKLRIGFNNGITTSYSDKVTLSGGTGYGSATWRALFYRYFGINDQYKLVTMFLTYNYGDDE